MKSALLIVFMFFGAGCASVPDLEEDRAAVLATLDSWNRGWSEGNASIAVEDYAEDTDWTNAFGDRFEGRAALRDGLEYIFGLGFVMAGSSSENEYTDVTFPSADVALLRSKLVRTGQQMPSGAMMKDRHIHHLRVLQRRNGKWEIVSHLISQAQEKGG